eukprot:5191045-Prymnesium_polylepis.2
MSKVSQKQHAFGLPPRGAPEIGGLGVPQGQSRRAAGGHLATLLVPGQHRLRRREKPFTIASASPITNNGERDGGSVMAIEVVRQLLAVASGVGARTLGKTAQQR